MTIDERLEFLMKSTESLHTSVHELYTTTQQHTEQVKEHTKQLAIDAENIRSLARIAGAH